MRQSLIAGGCDEIGRRKKVPIGQCGACYWRGRVYVRCMDNLSTGHIENIEPFMNNPRFTFIKGDIRDFDACKSATKNVDYVMHEAAWGSIPRSIAKPLLYEEINIRGTLNMMEASKQNGVKKFVYASSSSVYGDSKKLPKKEGNEGKCLAPYALTKHADEEYGRLYHEIYGLDTYGLRYFNVFGRRQDPDGPYAAVIPKFISQLINGSRPTIHGDGMQSRDFTYVDNVVDGNINACFASSDAAGQAFNIGAGGREYLIDVYHAICEALDVSVEPEYDAPRAGDIRDSNADISKAKELLGYSPKYDFRSGLSLCIE